MERAEELQQLLILENEMAREFILSECSFEGLYMQEAYIDDILKMPSEDLCVFLEENFYEEKKEGMIKVSSLQESDSTTRYELLGTYNWYNENVGAGKVFVYNKYSINCKNICILRESFIYSFEEEI